jgi:hypothetical protein
MQTLPADVAPLQEGIRGDSGAVAEVCRMAGRVSCLSAAFNSTVTLRLRKATGSAGDYAGDAIALQAFGIAARLGHEPRVGSSGPSRRGHAPLPLPWPGAAGGSAPRSLRRDGTLPVTGTRNMETDMTHAAESSDSNRLPSNERAAALSALSASLFVQPDLHDRYRGTALFQQVRQCEEGMSRLGDCDTGFEGATGAAHQGK